ncbi:MAG: hypothetical protein IPM41_01240 [Sphingomonadales bacterium]|nr:hypothetical protein [Sphingomonadales bacterium]
MSYASERKRANPASMALAIGVNGSIILAVALSPVIVEQIKRDPFVGRSIPVEPLPPPVDEKKPDTDTKPIKGRCLCAAAPDRYHDGHQQRYHHQRHRHRDDHRCRWQGRR